ncbi:DHA2 family efflux MFS transporter permease subunit [Streptomyces sp. NBC_00102]|uniref:DHA2 family efflux MFS transporter permease subunit n=1 Tax=Streptomyces sp. NBC_00102 TaxID=2975652 RepID=UPI002253323A|nr:DHA2 family efflux MFS transporter permease subunit [Streptomyces sp. NBC_00102]MCX5398095.1 DHA2 family efflux MFS transporter permease subunit [Streptomyces sp. NBC_00102]
MSLDQRTEPPAPAADPTPVADPAPAAEPSPAADARPAEPARGAEETAGAEPARGAEETAGAEAAPAADGGPAAGRDPAAAAATRTALFTIAVAVGGAFVAQLDTTIVNVSLADTSARFGAITQVQWVVTAYLLALVALMPAAGWLASRFGTRRTFVASVAVFGIGSAACAFSTTLPELIAARALSGAAAGVLVPVATILLTSGMPRERLGQVQALNGSVMLISPLLGPTVGGLLVNAWDWWAVYAVNIPLCSVLLVVALRRVRKDAPPARGEGRRPLDVLGLLTAAACTVGVVLAVHAFSQTGLSARPASLVPLVVAVVSGAVFVRHQLRTEAPLLNLRLFTHRVYRTAAINIFCLGFVLFSPMMLIPLYFESARGESAVTTGLLMSAGGTGVVVAGLACRPIMKKIGGGTTVVIGIVLTMLATVPLTALSSSTSYVLLCAAIAVRGLGTGLTIVPAMTRAFESVEPRSIPDASTQLNLVQRIGGTFALAVVTVVLDRAARSHHGLVPAAFADSFGLLLAVYALTLAPAVALLIADRREKAARAAAAQ